PWYGHVVPFEYSAAHSFMLNGDGRGERRYIRHSVNEREGTLSSTFQHNDLTRIYPQKLLLGKQATKSENTIKIIWVEGSRVDQRMSHSRFLFGRRSISSKERARSLRR